MIYRVLMDGTDILNYQEKPYILVSPTLTMELNAAGSFEFTMPPAHALYDAVKPLVSTIVVYEDETLLWYGRPIEVRTDFYKQKTIYCEGALAFFNDSIQRLHEYESISVHTFFRTIIENHNAQVNPDRQFTVGNITVADRKVYRKLNYDSTFNEFRYIRSYEKKFDLGPGTTLTIRTDASADYKHRMDALYRSWGFHPASVRVDSRMFDEKERVIYIHGLTFDLHGEPHPWTELYTPEEHARFAAALD